MLQRLVGLLAMSVALAAVLLGLARGWDFWTVVRRMAGGYFAAYLLAATFISLGRLAVMADEGKAPETLRKRKEAPGTDGTDAAL